MHSVAAVEKALRAGKLVTVNGNQTAFGGRFRNDQLSKYDGGHTMLVAGVRGTGSAKRFIISDPLSRVGALEITPAELKAFMVYKGWNTGLAIGR